MFETARVRAAHRSFGSLTLSVILHAAVIVAIVAATLSSTRLPVDPPRQMMPLIVASAIPLAGGTPVPAVRPRTASSTTPHAAVPRQETSPRTIPDAAAPAAATSPSTAGNGRDAGVPNGAPGGIQSETSIALPAADAAGPLPVGGSVKAPVVIVRVTPEYPRVALMVRKSGSVVVECVIDKSGRIRDARVASSTFGAFEKPALDAVQRWRFAPGTLNGQPVDTIFQLTVRFEVK